MPTIIGWNKNIPRKTAARRNKDGATFGIREITIRDVNLISHETGEKLTVPKAVFVDRYTPYAPEAVAA